MQKTNKYQWNEIICNNLVQTECRINDSKNTTIYTLKKIIMLTITQFGADIDDCKKMHDSIHGGYW